MIVEIVGFGIVKNFLYSLFDEGGFFVFIERVLEYYGGGEDGIDGIGDVLIGNVRSGIVDIVEWLVGVCKKRKNGCMVYRDLWW